MSSCKQVHTPAALPYYNTADFTPLFLDDGSVDSIVTHKLASFAYADQHSRIISTKALQHKIHVANFFFTSCGSVCPGMMENLKLVGNAFANDEQVELLSFSVTPWRDDV
jgi:protein SCO1/2